MLHIFGKRWIFRMSWATHVKPLAQDSVKTLLDTLFFFLVNGLATQFFTECCNLFDIGNIFIKSIPSVNHPITRNYFSIWEKTPSVSRS